MGSPSESADHVPLPRVRGDASPVLTLRLNLHEQVHEIAARRSSSAMLGERAGT